MKWLYIPFKHISQDDATVLAVKRYKKRYGGDINISRVGERKLKNVKDGDTVIIPGHGDINKDTLSLTTRKAREKSFFRGAVDKDSEVITANTVALYLKDDGLPKSHKFVKTLSCGGAGMAAIDHANIEKGDADNPSRITKLPIASHFGNGEKCFASVLALALGKLEYRNILVRGYPGYVSVVDMIKHVVVESGSTTEGYKLAEHKSSTVNLMNVSSKLLPERYWFDSQGKQSFDTK